MGEKIPPPIAIAITSVLRYSLGTALRGGRDGASGLWGPKNAPHLDSLGPLETKGGGLGP